MSVFWGTFLGLLLLSMTVGAACGCFGMGLSTLDGDIRLRWGIPGTVGLFLVALTSLSAFIALVAS